VCRASSRIRSCRRADGPTPKGAHEVREQRFRKRRGKNVAILKERRAGRTFPLPLAELRRRHIADTTTDENAVA
jgi:hypothetical protein